MTHSHLERCPDCGVELPKLDGPTHDYVGASPACWALFANLVNAGEPALAPAPLNALIFDAYIAQHHGVPSPQAIQSVAVHLLPLYGVFVQNLSTERVLWIRQRALRPQRGSKHGRFHWLTPPDFAGCPTIADIAHAPTPAARSVVAQQYVAQVWARWSQLHLAIIAEWYNKYVIPERL